jgi:hypothetical protein
MLIQGNGIPASGAGVIGAIRDAAAATGTNFQYLLATAQVESGFNPNAAAAGSSARGLFQFIDQTWLTTLKEAGAGLGYGRYADAIAKLPSGRYEITNPAMAPEIMALRNDPAANAAMAGAFTRHNAEILSERLGRQPTDGELYIAHFLGASGAGRLITLAAANPGASAASAFPGAARANRSIFYDRQGQPRTAAQVYGSLVGRYQTAAAQPRLGPPQLVAGVSDPVASRGPAATSRSANVAFVAPFASVPASEAGAPAAAVGPAAPAGGLRSLYSDTQTRGPVSSLVQELWSTRPSVAAALSGGAAPPAAGTSGQPLGLFADRPADARGLFGLKS